MSSIEFYRSERMAGAQVEPGEKFNVSWSDDFALTALSKVLSPSLSAAFFLP